MLSNHTPLTRPPKLAHDIFFLIVFMGIFYSLWIGGHALFIPDEGRYCEIAREMVASHDYITPRLDGVVFLDKPALYYWLQASAIHMFGLKEWALRFWPCVLGVLGTVFTFIAGIKLFNRRTGFLAAMILGTAPMYYGAAHYANLDLEVAVLLSCALLSFILSVKEEVKQYRVAWLTSAYIFAALAFLTKGLIGIAFPGLIIGTWILLMNRWSYLKQMHLFAGLTLFVMIAAPWYVLVQHYNPEFLHFFFVTQQVSRFLTTQDFNDKAAFWFYIPVVLAGLFPWSIFLLQSICLSIKKYFMARQIYAAEIFLCLWFLIVLVFFSIPKSKTVGYILPLFPPAALLVAQYIDQYWAALATRGIQPIKVMYTFICMILGSLFLFAKYKAIQLEISPQLFFLLDSLGFILLLSSLVSLLLWRKRFTFFIATLLGTIMALLLMFMSGAQALNEKSIKPLAVALKPLLKPQDEVVSYYKYYQDLPLYLERRITIVADWHASDIATRDNWLREIWYGMVFQNTSQWLIEDATFWQRMGEDKRLYVLTDQRYFDLIQQKKNVFLVARNNNVVLFTNMPLSVSRATAGAAANEHS